MPLWASCAPDGVPVPHARLVALPWLRSIGLLEDKNRMPRPTEVVRTCTWTLVQVAAEAQITRAFARAAVDRGLLPKGGYTESDVVLARVAAACLAFPDPTAAPARGKPDSSRRDATAIRFARATLTDPASTYDTSLLLIGFEVEVTNTAEQAATALQRALAVPILVLPVGRWKAMLPSALGRPPAHPGNALRLVKPAAPAADPTTGYEAFTQAKTALLAPEAPEVEDPFALS